MEQKKLIEVLGFVIVQNGEVFTFGEYNPYSLRDKDNPHHFHSPSFITEVMNTKVWQNLGLPNIEIKDIRSEISKVTKLGLVVALNATDGNFEASFPGILLASPETITEEQARVLLEKKEELLLYDKGIKYVRIIDKEGNTIDRPENVEEFYEKYINPQIVEQSPKK